MPGRALSSSTLVVSPICPSTKRHQKKKKSPAKKIAITCPAVLNGINDCPDTGCGKSLDPLLNQQKNSTQGDTDAAENMTFTIFSKLPKIVPGYIGNGFPRDKLKERGEGDMVRVVAWAIDSRPQNTRDKKKRGESCNCGFNGVDDPENTDVHIVLVSTPTLKLKAKAGQGKTAAFNTLKKREAKSQTAEYTPRLRVARNEEFDGSKFAPGV